MCRFVLTNARLATLVVARCHDLAQDIVHNSLCQYPSIDVRRDVLQRVAKRFKDLSGLKDLIPEETCQTLVESLRYAIFHNYSNVHAKYKVTTLVSRRGVLVDNAVYRELVDTKEYQSIKGHTVKKKIAGPNAPEIIYTACYRKDLGRYGISRAMVVLLLTLMSCAFRETFTNVGDMLEHAVARFLFIAVQVFRGRPIAHLVDFIVGHSAVVGSNARGILDAKKVSSHESSPTVPNVVAFSSLTLRTSGSLNMQHLVMKNLKPDSKAPAIEQRYHDERVATWLSNKKNAEGQFKKLWQKSTEKDAWIEVSPANLPSADIVLHLPGVLTLPIQCRDKSSTFKDDEIRRALLSMVGDRQTEGEVLGEKLIALRAPVIPILYVSRASTLTNFKYSYDMTSDKFEAVGLNFIIAECVGEKVAKGLDHITDGDQRRNAARLHNIRRTMMLFDFRPEQPRDVVVVATAVKQTDDQLKSLVTGTYKPTFSPRKASPEKNSQKKRRFESLSVRNTTAVKTMIGIFCGCDWW